MPAVRADVRTCLLSVEFAICKLLEDFVGDCYTVETIILGVKRPVRLAFYLRYACMCYFGFRKETHVTSAFGLGPS